MRGVRTVRSRRRLGLSALALATVGTVAVVVGAAEARQAASDAAARVARGEYLANSVAMCVQCHSTRDDRGRLTEAGKFRGGPVPVSPPSWLNAWALAAPSLAGLPGFTDDQVVALLTEGKMPGRPAPRRPMPPFRLTRADAEAIVAYLRSR